MNNQVEMLRHMIGIDESDRDGDLGGEPWRNYYAAEVGGDAESVLFGMVDAGLVERGGMINEGTLRYFRATDAGIQLARDNERERRRAAGLEGDRGAPHRRPVG